MLDRAETLIREQLAMKPTPKLLVALGDVTGQERFYVEAWEMSKCRYAPAMHELGILHFTRKNFAEAVEALEKAVKMQPLLVRISVSSDLVGFLDYCSIKMRF